VSTEKEIVLTFAAAGPKEAQERLKKVIADLAHEHNATNCRVAQDGKGLLFYVSFASGDKGQAITFQNVIAEQPYFKFVDWADVELLLQDPS